MEESVVDLRYRMKDVLKALERREEVTILHHGKLRGRIRPPAPDKRIKVQDHPFFNMRPGPADVEERMDRLRGGRYRAF